MANSRGPLLALSGAVLALLQGSSSPSGVSEAFAQPAKRPKDGSDEEDPLILIPPRIEQPSLLLAHRSHSSHSSHQSHSSGGYVGDPSGGADAPVGAAPAPAPAPPPKPARVTLVAYPGGRIFVDGKLVGTDSTGLLTLQAGSHDVRIENRFVGDTTRTVRIDEGQTGIIVVQW
jgi:hypothetical protein